VIPANRSRAAIERENMIRLVSIAVFCCLLFGAPPGGAVRACTSFCMDTPDGPVFGANLDLFIPGDGLVFVNQRGIAKEGYAAGTTGETAMWVSKYGSVTFNLAGREFAFSGMNETGLVVSSMELRAGKYPKPDERPPVGNGTWVQYVLDTCGDIEDVVRAISLVRIEDEGAPNHYLVADADGACAAVEWLNGRRVCYVGERAPVKAMTNMRYARALAARERGGPRWWWSNPGRSAERFAAAAARSESYDPDSDPNAVNYAFETLTRVVGAPHTKWSIVYDVAKREIWYRSAASPAVKHVSLGSFDFSCEAPLLMLDVNAALDGDVGGFFKPYDHYDNLSGFRTFCDRYGIKVSSEGAAELMQLFEGFGCAD
jgi:penicillin V acylase-like amidase (Ntn superfamily)